MKKLIQRLSVTLAAAALVAVTGIAVVPLSANAAATNKNGFYFGCTLWISNGCL